MSFVRCKSHSTRTVCIFKFYGRPSGAEYEPSSGLHRATSICICFIFQYLTSLAFTFSSDHNLKLDLGSLALSTGFLLRKPSFYSFFRAMEVDLLLPHVYYIWRNLFTLI